MTWYNACNIGLLAIIGIIITLNFNRILSERKLWVYFLGTYGITELIGTWISVQHQSNLWLYNVSRPIQFLFLLIYFSTVLQMSKSRNVYLLIAGVVVIAMLIISGSINSFNSFGDVVFAASIVILSVVYFNSIIRSEEPVPLAASEFWYCSALFTFYGSNLCVNGAMDFLIKNNLAVAHKLFYVIVGNTFVFYFLTMFALLSSHKIKPNS